MFDNFGKSSSYDRTLTISQPDIGTLGTNGTFYVMNLVNGNNIVTNSNGRTVTQGDLSVSIHQTMVLKLYNHLLLQCVDWCKFKW